ncbi:enoyl-CoA hydratase-related protein [Alkalihalobacillus sp. LMS6]|uniref:enoyl-CoA hydratase/isomerase family protein n=1 Tax=Bacillaceae TaxID=186817 RepID=UPI000C070CDC|nr:MULTISPECIES: enoyl-CoA hydratase-related protein [Bacillaceae]UTR08448.1 enoyl-CoA hydratase-related protein [Alkalihalobacillus sp. LMS6]
MVSFTFIKTSVQSRIGRIELNRPDQLNALNRQMVNEIVTALEGHDRNDEVNVILITGKGKAFSAGADIDEMKDLSPVDLERLNQFADWDRIGMIKKPILSAVQGVALGGGFELVLSCDLVLATEKTMFAFPEVTIGVMPGAGGTQRLTKLVGKTKALEWLLTGDRISAKEALQYGIINKIVQPELLEEEAIRFAERLATQPALSLRLIKDAVQVAQHASVYDGMQQERKNFYLLFASYDQKEGMEAFVDKRKPKYEGR